MSNLFRYRAPAAILLLLLLVGASRVGAASSGVTSGQTLWYNFNQSLSYQSPNGLVQITKHNTFFLSVLSVDNTKPPGQIQFQETYTEYANKTQTGNNTIYGTTGFFIPFDNKTYLPQIAFFPFIYTDTPIGSARLNISVSVTDPSFGQVTKTVPVNTTVTVNSQAIVVNFTSRSGNIPSTTLMLYDPSTGILNYGTTRLQAFGGTQQYTYQLFSITKPSSNFPIWAIVAAGAFILLGLAFVVDKLRSTKRRRRGERKRLKALNR